MKHKTNAPWGGIALLAILAAAGCTNIPANATINGRVTDEDGQPARDARVWTSLAETRTTVNGTYILRDNAEDNVNVFAETVQDGVTYRGRNVVRTVADAEQNSGNIVVFPTSRLARMNGIVEDGFGNPIVGARVFAYSDGYLTSATAVTGQDGRYDLRDLGSGLNYTVQAGAPGYSNDTDSLTLTSGQNRTFNFVLLDRGSPTLPQVTGLSTTTWVSPTLFALRGGEDYASAYENIKRIWSPERAAIMSGRVTNTGRPIEVELNWNRLVGDDFYGYGIYRGFGNGTITDYDFYREPLAGTFIDGDTGLAANQLYRYQISALSTGFPNSIGSEGPRSAIVEARTLNDLNATVQSTADLLRFNWNGNSGGNSFVVYIFDRFPSVGVSSIYNNQNFPATGTSFSYNIVSNPGSLVGGQTYYYLVLGLANGNASRTLSNIGTFVY